MDQANTSGLTEENTQASGISTKCRAVECSLGMTAGDTRESTLTTRNTERESSHGQMVVSTMASGGTENKTAMENTSMLKETLGTAGGKMENAGSGCSKKNTRMASKIQHIDIIIIM